MENLYKAADVRELDRVAINEFSIPGITLMERAGVAAFEVLRNRWPDCRKILVVCGRGNNAGDGYIVARLAHEAGYTAQVVSLTDLDTLRGDALTAARVAVNAGVSVVEKLNQELLAQADVVVDGVFGTGLDRPVEGYWHDAIVAINQANRPVLALDIPSGLNADTGTVMGIAVQASRTVTFIASKQGLYTGQGRGACGVIHLSALDVPTETYSRVQSSARLVHYADIAPSLIQPRKASAHKGLHGHVLVVGGDEGMSGALRLAGEAAARSGSGLVSLATRQQHAALLSVSRPELMSHGVEDHLQLKPLLTKASVIGVGPGLGQGDWGRAMLSTLLDCTQPMVVDADALNILAIEPAYKDNWVLTPHPGEAARLLDSSVQEIEHDRYGAVRELQRRYGGIVVLKGAGSLICYGDSQLIDVCGDGNPGMASGGMGDVLTGVLSSMLGQGYAMQDAVMLGVCLHSSAADAAAKAGQRGMLASDLFPHLRKLVNQQRQVI